MGWEACRVHASWEGQKPKKDISREKLVERFGARARAQAELVGHACRLKLFGELWGQSTGNKAAKDIPNHQGADTAIRLPERDDASKTRGCQNGRRHVSVGEPECCLVEQAEVTGVVQHQTKVLIRHAGRARRRASPS